MRKPYRKDALLRAVEECRRARITPRAFYIVGLPGDTVSSVCRDIVAFGRLGLAARPNNLKLYPGTAVTEDFLRSGLIDYSYDWRLSSFYTPNQPGITYGEIRQLKTILGAIASMTEKFGISIFVDDIERIVSILSDFGYQLQVSQGEWTLKGNFFRTTAYRHFLKLLYLRENTSAQGAQCKEIEKHVLAVRALPVPKSDISWQIIKAMRGEDMGINEPVGTEMARELVEPRWIVGDSTHMYDAIGEEQFDFIFSCPPYGDLEVYSDDPKDLSTQLYEQFTANYRDIIRQAAGRLRDDRFACFIVGDYREKNPAGYYRNFVSDTIAAFEAAGLRLYNEAILVTAVGSLPIRVGRSFSAGRKLGKTHQNVLVFCKGDPVKAAKACGSIDTYFPEEMELAQDNSSEISL